MELSPVWFQSAREQLGDLQELSESVSAYHHYSLLHAGSADSLGQLVPANNTHRRNRHPGCFGGHAWYHRRLEQVS